MPKGVAKDPEQDRRRHPAPRTGRTGGRKRKGKEANLHNYCLKVGDSLLQRMEAAGAEAIRQAIDAGIP